MALLAGSLYRYKAPIPVKNGPPGTISREFVAGGDGDAETLLLGLVVKDRLQALLHGSGSDDSNLTSWLEVKLEKQEEIWPKHPLKGGPQKVWTPLCLSRNFEEHLVHLNKLLEKDLWQEFVRTWHGT